MARSRNKKSHNRYSSKAFALIVLVLTGAVSLTANTPWLRGGEPAGLFVTPTSIVSAAYVFQPPTCPVYDLNDNDSFPTCVRPVSATELQIGQVGTFYVETYSETTLFLPNETWFATALDPSQVKVSLSPDGPWSNSVLYTMSRNGIGYASSPFLYFKGVSSGADLIISGNTANSYVGSSMVINIVNPPPQPPSAVIETSATELPAGWKQNMRIRVQNQPNASGTYRIVSDMASKLLFAPSASGPYAQYVDVSVTTGSNGSGVSSDFYAKALNRTSASAPPNITACPTTNVMPCAPSKSIKILSVFHISMARYFDPGTMTVENKSLDQNPNAGGGRRIFPEEIGIGDLNPTERKYVRLTAWLGEDLSGRQVEFKVFDVDDPSDDSVIDPNGTDGDDNRDLSSYKFVANGSKRITATTTAGGDASVVLAVGQNPGDNYRIAATVKISSSGNAASNDVLGSITNYGNVLRYETYPISDGYTDGPVVSTEMLTVWRRLHIERDSMGPVQGNLATGYVAAVNNIGPGLSEITLAGTDAELYNNKRFEKGDIFLYRETPGSANATYLVGDITGLTVLVAGDVPSTFVGAEFRLYDDDDMNGDDTGPGKDRDGDSGEDVPAVDLGWMQDNDSPSLNKFAPAYIRPTYDLIGTDNSLPFFLNTPNSRPARQPSLAEVKSMTRMDYFNYRKDPNYWIAYILNAYQTEVRRDGDRNTESTTANLAYLGITYLNFGSFCFEETNMDAYGHILYPPSDPSYDFNGDRRYTPVHEISHLLNTQNDDGGFISQTGTEFSNVSINAMRNTKVPTSGE